MLVKCLRYSASNSASLAVLCSGPNHQHQSLPSAANNDSLASANPVAVGASSRPSACADAPRAYASRASHSNSHAATSSLWPIQTSKLALIQDAGKIPLVGGTSGAAATASLAVSARKSASPSTRP